MAGGAKRQKARSKQTRKPSPAARNNGRPEPSPGDYAKEAVAEWAKAARYAAAAVTPLLKGTGGVTKSSGAPLKERLNPAKTEKGGRLGDAADFVLDKTGGKAGTVASKLSLGSRMVARLRGDKSESSGRSSEKAEERNGDEPEFKELPLPIQESMEVA